MKRDTRNSFFPLRARGFTLIELMIAVGIIAILAALLAPSVSTYMRRSQGLGAANEVANVLRSARNQAMSRGEVILATVHPRGDDGGSIVLERTDNLSDTNCSANSSTIDSTTDPNCFARSCAQAQSMGTESIFTFEISQAYPDMIIQGSDPEPDEEDGLELCFAPSGRVLGTNGLPLDGDCNGVNTRLFVRLDEEDSTLSSLDANPLDSSASLSACISGEGSTADTARQTQRNGRDIASFYSISVPFNGAISAKQ